VTAKARFLVPLLLAAFSLSGCQFNSVIGDNSSASQSAGEKNKTAGKQQDVPPDSEATQLEDRVKQAEERAKLAEEKAEFERQKREFAEQQLKQQEESRRGVADETSRANIGEGVEAPEVKPTATVPRRRSLRQYRDSQPSQSAYDRQQADSCTCPVEDEPEDSSDEENDDAEPPAGVELYPADWSGR
jgi:TolA-binding protein